MKVGQKKATKAPAKGRIYNPALPTDKPTVKTIAAQVNTIYSVVKAPIQSTKKPPTRRAKVKAI